MTGRLTPRPSSGGGWHWRFTVHCVIMILFLPPGWCGLQGRDYTARELLEEDYTVKKAWGEMSSLCFSPFSSENSLSLS